MNNHMQFAQLWWKFMQIPVEDFFPGELGRIVNDNHHHGRTMSPGYVGRDYQKGGWLLVGNYPAGGTSAYLDQPEETDVHLYGCFNSLRDAKDDAGRFLKFTEMSEYWINIQKSHRIYKNVIRPLLQAGGKADHDIAFINLFPFRCKDNRAPSMAMRRNAWKMVVQQQIDILSPSAIIALGKAAGHVLSDFYSGSASLHTLPRSNGDFYLTEGAKNEINELTKSSAVENISENLLSASHELAKDGDFAQSHAATRQTSISQCINYESLLLKLGFEKPVRGMTLKHCRGIPSMYYNRGPDGKVYFTVRKAQQDMFSMEMWRFVPPRQKKDDAPHLMTVEPLPGQEEKAFKSILDGGVRF
ncbi:hypothetical protein [Ectothiorhodospira magna]|nr:hypothetical protein [Ectothiorhodospira magna]